MVIFIKILLILIFLLILYFGFRIMKSILPKKVSGCEFIIPMSMFLTGSSLFGILVDMIVLSTINRFFIPIKFWTCLLIP